MHCTDMTGKNMTGKDMSGKDMGGKDMSGKAMRDKGKFDGTLDKALPESGRHASGLVPALALVLALACGNAHAAGAAGAAPLVPESPAPVPASQGQEDPGSVSLDADQGSAEDGRDGTDGPDDSGGEDGLSDIRQGVAKARERAREKALKKELEALLREERFEESLEELLPVSPDEVRRYLDARERLEGASDPSPATMESRARTVEGGLAKAPEVIRLTPGYSSTLLFQDMTGAPWPVLSAILGDPQAFSLSQPRVERTTRTLNSVQGDAGSSGNEAEETVENVHSHLVNLVPLANRAASNLVVTLEGADYPLVFHLVTESRRTHGRTNDALVVLRLAQKGPGAREAVLGPAPEFVGEELLGFAHGVPPRGARRLSVEPDDRGLKAWVWDGMVYVRSVHKAVWPAWTRSASMEGATVYVMPMTPSVVVSRNGKRETFRLKQTGQSE